MDSIETVIHTPVGEIEEGLACVSSSETFEVLMIDDDQELTLLVEEYLTEEGGFALTTRHDGESGMQAALDGAFDVIILDVMMPKMSGVDVLKGIRQHIETPVIMLTARGDEVDRIVGLEIGADDYVPKPCNLRELVARMRAILRRSQAGVGSSGSVENIVGDLRVFNASQSVYQGGKVIALTGAEFMVLEILIQSIGGVVDKDAIAQYALGRRITPHDRSVDTHVGNLRKKLGPLPSGMQRIKTVRGHGYLYVVPDE